MSTPPAIAILELDSIAVGALAADAMVKNAPIDVLRIGTVHSGKYLIVVGGDVAAVEEARRAGLTIGGERVTDEIFLADVHEQVYAAVEGGRRADDGDALGILETSAIPVNVAAADKAIKTAAVSIVEIRLGDGLGGKGLTVMSGLVHDVEAAMGAALEVAAVHPDATVWHSIIPIQHGDVRERIDAGTRFFGGNAPAPAAPAGRKPPRRG